MIKIGEVIILNKVSKIAYKIGSMLDFTVEQHMRVAMVVFCLIAIANLVLFGVTGVMISGVKAFVAGVSTLMLVYSSCFFAIFISVSIENRMKNSIKLVPKSDVKQ